METGMKLMKKYSSYGRVLILPMRNGNNKGGKENGSYIRGVLILPMRNGNHQIVLKYLRKNLVLILPMRNGNTLR